MAEKTLNTRIQQKHDIAVNWDKATGFIPKEGEIIIYDPDTTYNLTRIKVGDGKTSVINLPFIYEPITLDDIEEICGGVVYSGDEVRL